MTPDDLRLRREWDALVAKLQYWTPWYEAVRLELTNDPLTLTFWIAKPFSARLASENRIRNDMLSGAVTRWLGRRTAIVHRQIEDGMDRPAATGGAVLAALAPAPRLAVVS